MIFTVTMNPSLDYFLTLDNFEKSAINRASSAKIRAGGKGINVSLVLKNLGIESVALGFVAGFTGNEIEKLLLANDVKTDFVHLADGNSRINVKICEKEETQINATGPLVSKEAFDELLKKIAHLNDDDFLVLSGSVPNGIGEDGYEKTIREAGKGAKLIVDASGELLRKAAKEKPFLVKPNAQELGELYDVKIDDAKNAIFYAKKLQDEGAKNVIVSLAEKGAIFVTENGEIYQGDAIKCECKNSVGAGDSLVAGVLMAILQKMYYVQLLAISVVQKNNLDFH